MQINHLGLKKRRVLGYSVFYIMYNTQLLLLYLFYDILALHLFIYVL